MHLLDLDGPIWGQDGKKGFYWDVYYNSFQALYGHDDRARRTVTILYPSCIPPPRVKIDILRNCPACGTAKLEVRQIFLSKFKETLSKEEHVTIFSSLKVLSDEN